MRVSDGVSLAVLQGQIIADLDDSRDRALCQELAYGVLRWQIRLDAIIGQLLKKALKGKDRDIQTILRLAVYELMECRTPDYAVINDAGSLVRRRGKNWATGMVNAVLRRFVREKEAILSALADDASAFSHPEWMIETIRQDWPHHWRQILDANNQRPPIWLRVNARQTSRDAYQYALQQSDIEVEPYPHVSSALKLKHGLDVTRLPGFQQGQVSVQDAGAQIAAEVLSPDAGDRVLDLCAAPGGKTCHLLEACPDITRLVAVDVEAERMVRVQENLQRLQLTADRIVCDARKIVDEFEEGYFNSILVDAPCSASGVIRRHPDIKSLRRESDIAELVTLQQEILEAAWAVLAPGGQLLYVTCSVFSQENQQQIEYFLGKHDDAGVSSLAVDWGIACSVGRQLLPGENDADGFYYCMLQKK